MSRATSIQSIKKLSKKMPSGCIHFTGPICKRTGYAKVGYKGQVHNAHRVLWILTHGPIPEGLQVCHSCDNRKCINLDHLWLGTAKQNHEDMIKKGRWRSRSANSPYPNTHCIHGHELTPDNVYIVRSRPNVKSCRTCKSIEYFMKKTIKNLPLWKTSATY